MNKPIFTIALAMGCLLAFVPPVMAENYPSRTVTIIVPYPAGGPTDQVARIVAKKLTEDFKQNVIVENVSGGGTIIATNKVAHATPDGYTLLLHNLQISANVTLYKSLPFNTEKDLTTVMFINRNPLVLVGRKDLEAKTTKDLIALMKKKTLKAAIPGYGATGHLATALLAQEAGVKIDMIPYRGAAPALQDILGGHVDIFFATPQSVVQQVKAGSMIAYGITSSEKLAEFPNAASFLALFGPKLEFSYWQALFTPSGTPKDIISKLNAAMQKVVTDPDVLKIWSGEGVTAYPKDQRSVAAGAKSLRSEIERWGAVIKANDIHVSQ